MLLELEIKNFALIDEIHVNFRQGLNILTGETGVGKSIIINGIKLTLGERADRDWIRKGSEKAFVQSVFLKTPLIKKKLMDLGLNGDDDHLILSRELHKSGRSVSRINGSIVTNATIKDVADLIIDIHGQHSHQSLLNKSKHIDFLDDYIGTEALKVLQEFQSSYSQYLQLINEKESLSIDDRERERQIDLLDFQIKEIESANFNIGEEEELLKEYRILSNSEELYEMLGQILEILKHESMTNSAIDQLSSSHAIMDRISGIDTKVDGFKTQFEDIQFQLEDLYQEIRDYHDHIEYDEVHMTAINERIAEINHLKRKYGNHIEDIQQELLVMKKTYNQLLNSKEKVKELNDMIKVKEKKLEDLGSVLHKKRTDAAKVLQNRVAKELKDLNIPQGELLISIDPLAKSAKKERIYNEKGYDHVEFLIKTNPGEDHKPLTKIASGGEISRVMLALKSLLADVDKIPCLIFDEIDAGISGETGHLVGEKLLGISKKRQVICITHLAQIAARGDTHFLIYKTSKDENTNTYIRELLIEERIQEVGRLLGGTDSEITRRHASELLQYTVQ